MRSVMDRRRFLKATPVALAGPHWLTPSADAQAFGTISPLSEDHFPSRLYQFVWRNWELANIDRMAQIVNAQPDQLLAIGDSMGLPARRTLTDDYLGRIYITVIRQNWHLLPEDQIMELLGWEEEKYRFTLKEDDFLDVKLGRVKPACDPLRYNSPTESERRRAAEIRRLVSRWFGPRLHEPGEDRFAFVEELSSRPSGSLRNPVRKAAAGMVDLSSGWTLLAEGEARLAADNLRGLLTERMGVTLAPTGARKIVLRTDNRAGSDWTVESSSGSVTITASTPALLQRAVYDLQNEMGRYR